MSPRSRLALLLVAAQLLPAAPASAYLKFGVEIAGRVVPVRWAPGTIQYFVYDREAPGVTVAALEGAVAAAGSTWAAVPDLPVRFAPQGRTRSLPLDADGRSTIGFLDRPEEERVLGATTFLLDAETGAILESDIYFNTRFQWSVAEGGEPGRSDLRSVALHELGHLLGLGHSALGETELSGGGRRVLSTGAVMFPIAMPAGSIADRTLQPDDLAGVRDLYEVLPATSGSIQGRVTRGGRGVFGAHVVAFSLDTGSLIASYTLDDDGSFVIAGLPPGLHVLRVEPLDDADVESFFAPGRVDIAFGVTFGSRLAVVQPGGSTRPLTIEVKAR